MKIGRLQIRFLPKRARESLPIYKVMDIKLPDHFTQMEMPLQDFMKFADEYWFIVYESPFRVMCIDDKADIIFWAKKESKEAKGEEPS